MATVLKGYQGNKNPEDPIKDITSTYDPSIMVKKDEPVEIEGETGETKSAAGRRISKSIRGVQRNIKESLKRDDLESFESQSGSLKELKSEKASLKGWSTKKKVRKDIIEDPTSDIPSGYKAIWKKGEYVGARPTTIGPGNESWPTRDKKPKEKTPEEIAAFSHAASTFSMQPKKTQRNIVKEMKKEDVAGVKGTRQLLTRKGRKKVIRGYMQQQIQGAQEAHQYSSIKEGIKHTLK